MSFEKFVLVPFSEYENDGKEEVPSDPIENFARYVNSRQTRKAEQLLDQLKLHQISVDSEGALTIGGETVKNSNFLDIFKHLMNTSPKQNKQPTGVEELRNYLNTRNFPLSVIPNTTIRYTITREPAKKQYLQY